MDREWTDKRIDNRFDGIDNRFDQVDARFDRFERSVGRRFDKVDERFDRVEVDMKAGFAGAAEESKVASAKLDSRIELFDSKIDRVIWTMVSGFVTVLAAIAAKFILG